MSSQPEWSTSPSGPWLSSPPGVASIAPTVADTQTVNVGMGLDACLFRIRGGPQANAFRNIAMLFGTAMSGFCFPSISSDTYPV